ncbi:TPA: head maturation protease, ClpP-related, partial [Escherichia coli]
GHQSDADIYIYDEIGFWGVTAKQFISDLNALGDITHINLHINSPGGDVFEGIAIFNALKTHGASITVYVDGVAASMASVIAMVGNPVIMPENTFMMIHKPFGFTGGDAEDMRTYADLLDKVEAVLLSLVDGSGNPVSVEVQSVTDGLKVKVNRVPDGVAEYSVWGLKLPTLRQRLFRCVSIRENDDGTYAITAVQHVPEKEAIVDNGAHFDGDQSGTVNGVTPPAVQHLTAEVTADSGEYQVLARWDTPKVVKGVSFLLRLTVAADDGSERLVSTARTTETTYRFTQLALGRYMLTVRAVNAWGLQGDPASVSFRIAAPAAPSRIELTPGYFQITATPHLAVYDP